MRGEVLANNQNIEAQYASDEVLQLLFSSAKYRLYKGDEVSEALVSAKNLKKIHIFDLGSALVAYHKHESDEEPYPFLCLELTRNNNNNGYVSKRRIVIRNPNFRFSDFYKPVSKLEITERIEDKKGNLIALEPQKPFLDLDEANRLHSIIINM